MSDVHDLTALYVVGALDAAEEKSFEAHLEECTTCRAEVAQLRAGAEALALAVAEPAPGELKSRVMSRIDALATPPARATVIPLRRRLTRRLMAVAALLVLVVAVASTIGERDPIAEVLAADDLVVVDVGENAAGTVTFSYSDELDRGVFSGENLAGVGPQETYALWLIPAGGEPRPAGLFVPSVAGGVELLVEGAIDQGVTLGLTVEPAGGSDQPTGEILFAEEL